MFPTGNIASYGSSSDLSKLEEVPEYSIIISERFSEASKKLSEFLIEYTAHAAEEMMIENGVNDHIILKILPHKENVDNSVTSSFRNENIKLFNVYFRLLKYLNESQEYLDIKKEIDENRLLYRKRKLKRELWDEREMLAYSRIDDIACEFLNQVQTSGEITTHACVMVAGLHKGEEISFLRYSLYSISPDNKTALRTRARRSSLYRSDSNYEFILY